MALALHVGMIIAYHATWWHPDLPSSLAKNRWHGLPRELLRRDLAIGGQGVTI